ncbi:MAG: hypothetical protein E7580_01875 [Ruminococcaceae bacterium]|nr:hypothetical protein [Oscillospiraceae bacterium]
MKKDAFKDCFNLTSVTIPSSVVSITDSAFDGCYALKDVQYGGTKSDCKRISIGTCNESLTDATWHCKDGKASFGEEKNDSPIVLIAIISVATIVILAGAITAFLIIKKKKAAK